MKIAVLGTRGFPGIQGGVEMHCEQLYTRLAKMGCEVTVFTRKHLVNPEIKSYKNVKFIPLDVPPKKSVEAIYHTFKGVFAAKKINPDIVHIHAVGPSLLILLARLLGLKTVMTNHGPDYKRMKWGWVGKIALRAGELVGSYFANEIICISEPIARKIKRKFKRKPHVIPNGVEMAGILESDSALKKYSLTKGKYILAVGRFVPEKGFCELADAFLKAKLREWKLVIVGEAGHEKKYSFALEKKAKRRDNIVLTGFLTGKPLGELYSHAGLFVMPSYYEGLSIVFLEALSHGLLCLVSDIPANRFISLPEQNYFPAGNIRRLSEKLQEFIKVSFSPEQKHQQMEIIRQNYNWDDIARKTLDVYRKVSSNPA
ncbi:MAG: glycosyltransferase family 4 protein [Candidatus Omnitrophota bacterium]|nr:MAG: glycosyltransferase family 4 protein [Candidatus Omnitrophota bacterium]